MSILSDCAHKNAFFIEESIVAHPAWQGRLAGLEAEALLKECKIYTFLLREGEKPSHYYISFAEGGRSVRHQPFAIIYTQNGWYCRQGDCLGPFKGQSIDDIAHWIIHREKEECIPYNAS